MVNHLSNYDFCLHCLEICSHSGLRSSDRGEEAHKYTFIHNHFCAFYRVSEDTSITGLRIVKAFPVGENGINAQNPSGSHSFLR
jgi:hypothetical protein